MMTTKEVIEHLECSKNSLCRWIKLGQFPKPIVRGAGRGNFSKWVRSDVEEWARNSPIEKRGRHGVCPKKASKALGIILPRDLFDDVKSIAEADKTTVSNVLRRYIKEGVENDWHE